MKIAYISKYTILPEYGPPTRQYFLSKYLTQAGNDVMLIGSRSSYSKVPKMKGYYKKDVEGSLQKITLNGPVINTGFNLRRIWSWLVFELNLFRFRKNIKVFAPDVVIVSSLSILTFLYGVFLKRWLGIPLVLEIRDIYPLTLTEVGGYSQKHPAVRILLWIEKIGYKNADLLMSTLPNAKEHFANVLQKPFNFKWLPMGIDLSYYAEDDKAATGNDKFERKPGEFYICYVGNISSANAFEVIFDAAADLEKTHPAIKFVIVGFGSMKEFYKEKYAHLGNLTFMDEVSKKEVQSVSRKMDLLLSSWRNKSIYRFGVSPNKWMDYMLAARPILAVFSGYQCIINDADCGSFIPAEDKEALKKTILEYYSKPKEELDRIGQRGKEYLLKNHDYKNLASELYIALNDLKK